MNRGRTGSSRAVTGLGSVCIGCVGLVAVACGDSFTTAPADGGSTPDAITTGPAGDAGKSFCASLNPVPTFCEDFSSGVPDMLSTTMSAGGGAIVADTADYKSAPTSLSATTPRLTTTGATATAIATKSFSSAMGSHFSLAVDLEIDSACLSKNDHNPVSVLAIEFPEDNYGVAIQLLPNEVDVVEIALLTQTQLQVTQYQTIPLTGWERWTLDIHGAEMLTANAVAKTLTLGVGSTPVFKQDLKKAPAFALVHPTLVVGAVVKNLSDQSPACKVHVDDIVFDVRAL